MTSPTTSTDSPERHLRKPESTGEANEAADDCAEDDVVAEGEKQAEDEVKCVAGRLRAHAVRRHDRPEQEGNVHAREPELARGPQQRREHDRPHDPSRDGAPDHRPASCARANETAALISARCVSAWGKLPRNSPLSGSISSA